MQNSEYVDAAQLARTLNLWTEMTALTNRSIQKRPEYLRLRLVELAKEPIAADARLTEEEWNALDEILRKLGEVLIRAHQDMVFHPRMKPSFPSGIEESAAKASVSLQQAREAVVILRILPEQGKMASFRELQTGRYKKIREWLLKKVAKLWYETPQEDVADELFAGLQMILRSTSGELAIKALQEYDDYPRIDRIRRAFLYLHNLPGYASTAEQAYSKLLAGRWLDKLSTEEAAMHIMLDHTLDGTPSKVAQALLQQTAQRIAQLDKAAKLFAEKGRLRLMTVPNEWDVVNLDIEHLRVHLRGKISLMRGDRRHWHELEEDWYKRLEEPNTLDEDVEFFIEIVGRSSHDQTDRTFQHTIRAKQPATV